MFLIVIERENKNIRVNAKLLILIIPGTDAIFCLLPSKRKLYQVEKENVNSYVIGGCDWC